MGIARSKTDNGHCRHRQLHGFTLVELVVTLAIAAILVTVAIPGFGNLIRDNRLIAGTNQLVATLALARSEAVKRGAAVSICASNNGTGCTSTDWNDGWLVFSDAGTAGTVDGGDTVLRVQEALRSDLQISVSGDPFVRFGATGFALAECNTDCTGAAPDYAQSRLARLIAALLPGQAARAAGAGGTTTTSSDANNTAGTATVTQFTLCDGRNGETGRRIVIWSSGRYETQAVSCDAT